MEQEQSTSNNTLEPISSVHYTADQLLTYLVDFGNYLLSDKRKETLFSGDELASAPNVVGHWDIENWKKTLA